MLDKYEILWEEDRNNSLLRKGLSPPRYCFYQQCFDSTFKINTYEKVFTIKDTKMSDLAMLLWIKTFSRGMVGKFRAR